MSTNYTESIAHETLVPSLSHKPLEVQSLKKGSKTTQLLLVIKSTQLLNMDLMRVIK